MNNYEYIEKYFQGNLTNDERIIFEKLVVEDADFFAAFSFEKELKKAITLNENIALKQLLQSYEKPKISPKLLKWLSVAASVLLIASVLTWKYGVAPDSETLYLAYYQPYPNVVLPTLRGETQETADAILTNAYAAYDSKKYLQAIELFSKIQDSEKDDYSILYEGIAYMELERYKDALELFRRHNTASQNALRPLFMWYSALANLRLENKDEAIIILKNLVQTDNPQQQLAIRLLADLE